MISVVTDWVVLAGGIDLVDSILLFGRRRAGGSRDVLEPGVVQLAFGVGEAEVGHVGDRTLVWTGRHVDGDLGA